MPYESRADSVMYCQVLAGVARERGWKVSPYDAKRVEEEAVRILGERADEVLRSPRDAGTTMVEGSSHGARGNDRRGVTIKQSERP